MIACIVKQVQIIVFKWKFLQIASYQKPFWLVLTHGLFNETLNYYWEGSIQNVRGGQVKNMLWIGPFLASPVPESFEGDKNTLLLAPSGLSGSFYMTPIAHLILQLSPTHRGAGPMGVWHKAEI